MAVTKAAPTQIDFTGAPSGQHRDSTGSDLPLNGNGDQAKKAYVSTGQKIESMPEAARKRFAELEQKLGPLTLSSTKGDSFAVRKNSPGRSEPSHIGMLYPDGTFKAKARKAKNYTDDIVAEMQPAARARLEELKEQHGRLILSILPNGRYSVSKHSEESKNEYLGILGSAGEFTPKVATPPGPKTTTTERAASLPDPARKYFEELKLKYPGLTLASTSKDYFIVNGHNPKGDRRMYLGRLYRDGTFKAKERKTRISTEKIVARLPPKAAQKFAELAAENGELVLGFLPNGRLSVVKKTSKENEANEYLGTLGKGGDFKPKQTTQSIEKRVEGPQQPDHAKIDAFLRSREESPRDPGQQRLTDADKERIAELKGGGMTWNNIARKTGIPSWQVRSHLAELERLEYLESRRMEEHRRAEKLVIREIKEAFGVSAKALAAHISMMKAQGEAPAELMRGGKPRIVVDGSTVRLDGITMPSRSDIFALLEKARESRGELTADLSGTIIAGVSLKGFEAPAVPEDVGERNNPVGPLLDQGAQPAALQQPHIRQRPHARLPPRRLHIQLQASPAEHERRLHAEH